MPRERNGDESRDEAREQQRDAQTPQSTDRTTKWLAASAARLGLVFVGLVLLLFALGQAVGVDLLGLAVDAVSSQVGQWLVVAFFAVVLIAIAARWGRLTTAS